MQTNIASSKVVEVRCFGSPKEMGLAQGAALQSKIRSAHEDALRKLEAFRLQQPRWLPYRAYRWLAEQKAWRFLASPLSRDYPAMSQRLSGIAEGAGVSLRAIYLLNALEPFLSLVGGCTTCPGAVRPLPSGADAPPRVNPSSRTTLIIYPWSNPITLCARAGHNRSSAPSSLR